MVRLCMLAAGSHRVRGVECESVSSRVAAGRASRARPGLSLCFGAKKDENMKGVTVIDLRVWARRGLAGLGGTRQGS